jgi:hypothetical protein
MALQYKKSRGESTGVPLYGYRVSDNGKSLIEDAGEQEIIALIVKLRKRTFSYSRVADYLNQKGYRNRKKGIWKPSYVYGIVKAVKSRKSK